MKQLIVILPNIRSAHNVGSIFRTVDAAGAAAVWTTGLTPHPIVPEDARPPHVADRAHHMIAKTALGAEGSVLHRHFADLPAAIAEACSQGFTVAALEQDDRSTNLFDYGAPNNLALVLGPEVEGLDRASLDLCDDILEIPMRGTKESLNVSVAAGIALYQLLH